MPGMNEDVTREVEQFLYREARLLDERRFHEWLELLTDDVHYWMGGAQQPLSEDQQGDRDPRSRPLCRGRSGQGEDELAILDEDKASLTGRVARLDTGMAWAEDPPSRTRHLITNIEVEPGDGGSGGQGLFQFHRLSQPSRDRAGFLCRRPTGSFCGGSTAPGRSPAARSLSTRTCCRQERQHLLLSEIWCGCCRQRRCAATPSAERSGPLCTGPTRSQRRINEILTGFCCHRLKSRQ